VEANTPQPSVRTAALKVNGAGIPIYPLLDNLTVKIKRKHSTMALTLLAASHYRGSNKFWKFYGHSN
jgi:hypothetical protein